MKTRAMFVRYIASTTLLLGALAPAHLSFAAPAELKELSGAVLKDIRFTTDGGGSRIEILATKPLVYTFYKSSAPLKAVIDLSETDPGRLPAVINIDSSIVGKVNVRKNELAGGTLTRLEIDLLNDVDVKVVPDPVEKDKLLVLFAAGKVGNIASEGVEKAPAPVAAKAEAVRQAATLKDVSVTAEGIEIALDGKPESWKSFRLSKPERLVIDLFGVRKAPASRIVPLNKFGLETARIGLYPEKVRIVLDAVDAFPASSVVEGESSLVLKMGAEKPAPLVPVVPKQEKKETAPAVAAPAKAPAPVEAAPAPPVRRAEPAVAEKPLQPAPEKPLVKAEAPKAGSSAVGAISFQQIDGYSRVAIAVGKECREDEPARVQDGLILSLHNCELPKKLQRTIETASFPTVVQKITPYQVKGKAGAETRIRLTLKGSPDYRVSRDEQTINLDVANPEGTKAHPKRPQAQPVQQNDAQASRPAADEEEKPKSEVVPSPKTAEKKYTGRRVTLEFADADIRKIFQLLAEVSNLNFLIGDDVSGTISIKLVNVPWDQALDVILDTKGLGMKRIGNIVQIKPMSKMQTAADEEVAAKKASEKVMELKTEIFDINYASVGEVATQLATVKSTREGTSITQDARTNRLIVTDIAPSLEKMRYLLKNIDLPEKQVMIEARIVEATTTFTRDLGVNWGFHYRDGSAPFGINAFDGGFGGQVATAPTSGTGVSPGGAVGISFGSLLTNVQLDMRLSAAATAGQIKIISSPKIATLNNKAAKITQGQQIAYQNSTSTTQGASITFVEAALTLEVTPHINADGTVIMKIKASNNAPGPGAANANPPINKKEATTELLVRDGQTTVIGGIYVDSDTSGDSGVPFLMDIPLIGYLFKSNSKNNTKTELLIFITPRILT